MPPHTDGSPLGPTATSPRSSLCSTSTARIPCHHQPSPEPEIARTSPTQVNTQAATAIQSSATAEGVQPVHPGDGRGGPPTERGARRAGAVWRASPTEPPVQDRIWPCGTPRSPSVDNVLRLTAAAVWRGTHRSRTANRKWPHSKAVDRILEINTTGNRALSWHFRNRLGIRPGPA